MRLRFLRSPLARIFFLLAALAPLAFPNPGVAKGGGAAVTLDQLIPLRVREFQFQASALLSDARTDFALLPDVVDESGFTPIIEDFSVLTQQATSQYGNAYGGVINTIRNDVQSLGVDPRDANELRGTGGSTDGATEGLLWASPSQFAKSLQMSLRGTRLAVERFNAQTDRFDQFTVKMSVQIFPTLRDQLLFTASPSPALRLETGGIIGGSYRVTEENDARTTACLFGWAPANTQVNLMAEGLGGPYNTSDTSDSTGGWDKCFTGLKHGYYKFTADDGSTTDVKEQGFLLPSISLKF